MSKGKMALALLVFAIAPVWALAADLSGVWHAKWETQMGDQEYTYTFAQKGTALTGKAKNPMGEVEIMNGKVDNDTVTFVENVNFGGMDIAISYTGKIVSPDEIKFSREVGTFATEMATAKRGK